jgi:hypothetical protein
MIYILLQAIDPLVFKDASPFGTAIYGLFVLALIGAIIYLVRKVDSKEKDYKDLAEKTMVVITEVKEKMLDDKDYKSMIVNKLDDLYKAIINLKK